MVCIGVFGHGCRCWLLAPLCSSGGRRFRKLVRIHKLNPDIAGGVHVGKDDLDNGAADQGILFCNGYGLDAVNETAILFGFSELKPGAVVTAFQTSGFCVETVQCKDLGFTVWGVGGLVEVHPPWRHFHQSPSGLIHGVNSNDRNKVVDAEEELNRSVQG